MLNLCFFQEQVYVFDLDNAHHSIRCLPVEIILSMLARGYSEKSECSKQIDNLPITNSDAVQQ